jgi:hypothetical protein
VRAFAALLLMATLFGVQPAAAQARADSATRADSARRTNSADSTGRNGAAGAGARADSSARAAAAGADSAARTGRSDSAERTGRADSARRTGADSATRTGEPSTRGAAPGDSAQARSPALQPAGPPPDPALRGICTDSTVAGDGRATDALLVTFEPDASPADRKAAAKAVGGTLVESRMREAEGAAYVQVPGIGGYARLQALADQLIRQEGVRSIGPVRCPPGGFGPAPAAPANPKPKGKSKPRRPPPADSSQAPPAG